MQSSTTRGWARAGALTLMLAPLVPACAPAGGPGVPGTIAADTLVAYENFETLEVEGYAPYYRNPERGALAIQSPKYPDRFAAAETRWRGAPGTYELTLVTLTERDGESTYRLLVNGRQIGEFQNPPGPDDELVSRTWTARLEPGDRILVSSNSHTNRKEREGEGFATSRGRWRYLIVKPAG